VLPFEVLHPYNNPEGQNISLFEKKFCNNKSRPCGRLLVKSFSYVFGFTENPFQYVGGDAHICPRAVIFWGSHVKTVRRNSLVALAVRLGLANAGCCPCLWLFDVFIA